jgi:outer membrane immunogenic protein
MRYLSLGCIAAVMIGGLIPALAADQRLPTKAPPMVRPAISFTGCYVGANFGGGWARESYADPTVAPPAGLGAHTASGMLGGGQVGCDYQAGAWVFGVQGMYDWANLSGSHFFPEPPAGDILATRIPWLATVTGRVGYTLKADLLVYLKGGVASKREKETDTDIVAGPEGFANVTRTGGLIGAGLEYQFAPRWSAFVEGNYIDFGNDTINYTPFPPEVAFPLNIRENVWMVLVGVNYRFSMSPFRN